MSRQARLMAMRARLSGLESAVPRAVLPFGDPRVDGCFPGAGLPLGCWHEVTGEGMEIETAAVAAAMALPSRQRFAYGFGICENRIDVGAVFVPRAARLVGMAEFENRLR